MRHSNPIRKTIAVLWLTALFASILAIFWYQEWIYERPTPVPADYKPIAFGTRISYVKKEITSPKPVLLHFFNPDCPCSRFNMPYFKSLVKKYGKQAEFRVVLIGDKRTTDEVKRKYELDIPVMRDSALAKECGIYSTPQAVLLEPNGALYYRGNYNKSRYCSNEKTNYAEHALRALLGMSNASSAIATSSTIYGCSLPECKKPALDDEN